jgi:hypothetical protein
MNDDDLCALGTFVLLVFLSSVRLLSTSIMAARKSGGRKDDAVNQSAKECWANDTECQCELTQYVTCCALAATCSRGVRSTGPTLRSLTGLYQKHDADANRQFLASGQK